jgi:hypothetical protein
MNAERLDELEKLLAAATPRPWEADCAAGISQHWSVPNGKTVIGYEETSRAYQTVCKHIWRTADIEAIVALVNIAPELLAVARAASEQRVARRAANPQFPGRDDRTRQLAASVAAQAQGAVDAALDALERKLAGAPEVKP